MTRLYKLSKSNRRTVLKLLGAGAVASGIGASTASAQEIIDSEIEGPLQEVDEAGGTITVMGVTVDVGDASITSPTTDLTFSDLTGDPFPGRDSPGFVGGTAIAVGTTEDTGGVVTAADLFVEPAENVIVGAVTENSVSTNGSNEDAINEGTFAVQGVEVRTADDDRLPFHAVMEGTEFGVDIETVPEGSLAEVEGYYGDDGILYAHSLEVSEGETDGQASTTITRARCDEDDDDPDELEVRGESSTPDGTICVHDHHTDELLGRTEIEEDDAGTGEFRLRAEIEACPSVVRAENSNGSEDVATVDT